MNKPAASALLFLGLGLILVALALIPGNEAATFGAITGGLMIAYGALGLARR